MDASLDGGLFLYNFGVTVILTSDLVENNRVLGIFPILFELGIPNLVCNCILGWQSVMYQFVGHCDLDIFS